MLGACPFTLLSPPFTWYQIFGHHFSFLDRVPYVMNFEFKSNCDSSLPTFLVCGRALLDAEICKYVEETYSNGNSAVYCTCGNDVAGPGENFEFTVVISVSRQNPKNFWYTDQKIFYLLMIFVFCF